MKIKYDTEFSKASILETIDRITNQIFKLLPMREEGGDWQSLLLNLILEVIGLKNLIPQLESNFFYLLCKLETLNSLTEENDFLNFRKVIFESLGVLKEIKQCLV